MSPISGERKINLLRLIFQSAASDFSVCGEKYYISIAFIIC
ncbi:hypothetical protein HMPREF9442_03480 [Paraprevotella xylaniphila YIT 11841]|uniref:Uncharacterized protein n=1 Tax=Paraprevotella xylaniphila YIT 11841 TaxID=762982 RepID=F3QZ34_9BACT|nr:hypothetical protein HMPREF9442_03480 [Paraprevotella xylaniphila YIT 11841]